jgi:hypothetical protein
MSLILMGGTWGLLFVIVLALAGVRKHMTKDEDDTVHLGEAKIGVVQKQLSLSNTLTQLDRWGKVLTVATVLYGLALVGRFIYMGWVDSSQLHN